MSGLRLARSLGKTGGRKEIGRMIELRKNYWPFEVSTLDRWQLQTDLASVFIATAEAKSFRPYWLNDGRIGAESPVGRDADMVPRDASRFEVALYFRGQCVGIFEYDDFTQASHALLSWLEASDTASPTAE